MSSSSFRILCGSIAAAFALGACTDVSPVTGPNSRNPGVASFSGGSTSGGGGGGSLSGSSSTDVIKINKHGYEYSNRTLLFSGSSSNSSAHLYLYAPDGSYIGEMQNGGGGQYGGTVFIWLSDPVNVTIKSSAGGTLTVPTVPIQP